MVSGQNSTSQRRINTNTLQTVLYSRNSRSIASFCEATITLITKPDKDITKWWWCLKMIPPSGSLCFLILHGLNKPCCKFLSPGTQLLQLLQLPVMMDVNVNYVYVCICMYISTDRFNKSKVSQFRVKLTNHVDSAVRIILSVFLMITPYCFSSSIRKAYGHLANRKQLEVTLHCVSYQPFRLCPNKR